jgi:hypothetical protein
MEQKYLLTQQNHLTKYPIKNNLAGSFIEEKRLGEFIRNYMKWVVQSLLFSAFLMAYTMPCLSQKIELKHVEFKDNKVIVIYNLLDSIAGRYYSIRLYSSSDGFLNPLTKVAGDVGLEIKPGLDKKVVWTAKDEPQINFDQKISIEIRGRVFIPFIDLENINHYKVFKRNRNYNLTWSGGSPQNILNFDLYNGERKVASFPNIGNVGHHTFRFPSHTKPSDNYRFRISDAKNKDEVVFTEGFKIKRKVPLLLKIIPVVAVSYFASILLKPGKDDSLPLPYGTGDFPAN